MNVSNQNILHSGETFNQEYTVLFFIKKGSHAESYRVKDNTGNILFLKLFHLSKMHRTQFDNHGNVKEIEFLKALKHPNIVRYRDSGEWINSNQRFAYLVLEYISGETLAERIKRDHHHSGYEIKQIIEGVLNGLKYLHTREEPIVHNDINHQNIMLDLSGKISKPNIIDFGYSRFFRNSTKVYYRRGLNPYYLAPECFNNIFSPQSDLFSVGALIYHLIFGIPPWFMDLSEYQKNSIDYEEAIIDARSEPLKFPALNEPFESDREKESLLNIAKKALLENTEERFSSAEEMIRTLNGEIKLSNTNSNETAIKTKIKKTKSECSGFDAIAGMEELKESLYQDVIRALEEKELYEEYGLTIPNGILLYGPPGCGKSFFAEKLAEEVDYNYILVKPSSLASIYVHGTQEKIQELFENARENAPTILNFEEFDALVPSRTGYIGKNQSGEVNEFLSQLNNCGKDGVFVIASTNQPKLIDSAVLRAGRIDKIFFVPPPDFKARKEIFRTLLEKRPLDFGIDFGLLAEKTENYVSVDIQHLVNEASRKALKTKSKITQEIILTTIYNILPSVKVSEIERYNQIKAELEGIDQSKSNDKPSIGFNINN